ncbi:hypothetical protein R6Q57_014596 [Mikania cordata]
MAEVDDKRNEVTENLCSTSCIEKDARHQIVELSSELEQVKTHLSKTKIKSEKYEYSSTVVANMIDVQSRRKEKIGFGFTEVKPPFNHNYSIMSNINTSVDELLLKLDRRFEFTTGSNKPVQGRRRRKEVLAGA